jgi:nucleoside-diphosphate-sugar epimerase
MRQPKVLVTGATGFVGHALVKHLGVGTSTLSTRTPVSTWPQALHGVDCVVHLAARVHRMDDGARDKLSEYRKVNVDATLELARMAAANGVKRFIFMSSVKVNGEFTLPGRPFRADDSVAPVDPYGISKYEAELALRSLAQTTGLEVVIIRSPLVYGPGVKANFESMVRWVHRGIPLPLGSIHNCRSLVALDNLVSLIEVCTTHAAAPGRTFMVSDGCDVSTTQLLRMLSQSLGKNAHLIPVPALVLKWAAFALGQAKAAQRLLGSLQVDIEDTRATLNWAPVVGLQTGLDLVAKEFLAHS